MRALAQVVLLFLALRLSKLRPTAAALPTIGKAFDA
jgi:hypothetical protein